MKKIKRILVYLLLLSFSAAAFGGCGTAPDDSSTDTRENGPDTVTKTGTETETEPAGPVLRAVYPGDGQTVSLLNEEMTAWLEKYKAGKLDKICDFTEKCEPVPVLLSWESDGALYSHVLVADNAGMEDAKIYLTAGDSLLLEDLYGGQEYFWQVRSEFEDKTVVSRTFSFYTLDFPRTVAVDGVSNVRDIGGYKTEDGKRIKRGVVYRGADFERITDEGKNKLTNVLGIKTELDLRERTNRGPSVLGEGVNYVAVSGPWYGNAFTNDYKADLAKELRVFADPDNYPVFFHCSLGRDRTGTLAFLLEALCGVSKNDMYKDYEISFFSDLSGYSDHTPPSTMKSNLESFRQSVQNYAKTEPLSAAARAFMISLGLTDGEVDAIRANLLEDAG